jgi:hypothetical protein
MEAHTLHSLRKEVVEGRRQEVRVGAEAQVQVLVVVSVVAHLPEWGVWGAGQEVRHLVQVRVQVEVTTVVAKWALVLHNRVVYLAVPPQVQVQAQVPVAP